jgi:S1-C subfamily serine protease
MSEHTIHLRSENPPLLVEFNLPPGTHARIGSSPDAEVFLPLAGLTEFVCMIGRTPEGNIYTSESDGGNPRFHELPAALPLPPYQFVIFHPSGEAEKAEVPSTHLEISQPRVKTFRQFIPAAIVAAIVIAFAALIAIDQSKKPATTSPRPQLAITQQDAAPVPPIPATIEKPNQPAPPPIVEIKPAPKEPEHPAPKFNLEALAQRIAPAVFRLEVKNAEGDIIGTGTAFAVSTEGLAVTNFHVVEKGKTFIARTNQGAEFTVSGVVATDPQADLALISLKASNIPFLELGESETLKIGVPIAVFGCPQGLSGTLSEGILSARRTEPEIAGKTMPNGGKVLQITAPISAGSSGSPVIDQSGKVIGVAAAVLSGQTTQNLNFVIPVEAIRKHLKDKEEGLGVSFNSIKAQKQAEAPVADKDPEIAFMNDPDYAAYCEKADVGDMIECVKIGKKLAKKHPGSKLAHLFLGFALQCVGLYEEAESSSRKGLEIDPDDAMLWRQLGDVLDAQGKSDEARNSWKRAAVITPDNADIWERLAESHIRQGRYVDAIAPMENLRKLDNEKFDKLHSSLRSQRRKTPQLQTLLDRFNEEPPKALPIEESLASPEELAVSLITAFLKHGEEPDIQTELADYAENVDPYFDQGQKGKPAILRDLTTYRAQWPHRTLRMIAIESARRDGPSNLEATYRLQYTASDGKRNRSGTIVQEIRYTLTHGRWLVSGIKTLKRLTE